MRKVRVYKCFVCHKKYKCKDSFYHHIETKHPEVIPDGMSVAQYYFNLRNKKEYGTCVICGKRSPWLEKSERYSRFCSESCKNIYKEQFRQRMIDKYGKVHLLDDPERQRELLTKRKISGVYVWSDRSHRFNYTGSYERDFLRFMDKVMHWDPLDLIAPSPHTFYYEYDGQRKFYIPDFYIPSLNLQIEIKSGGDNPNRHPKILAIDNEKDRLKMDSLISTGKYNFVKITNKNYDQFIEVMDQIRKQSVREEFIPVISINESIEFYKRLIESENSLNLLHAPEYTELIDPARWREYMRYRTGPKPLERLRVELVKHNQITQLLDEPGAIRKLWLASDWHLFSERTGLNWDVVEKSNAIMRNSDVLLFMGDLLDHNASYNEVLEAMRLVNSIRCKKYIMLGNHDVLKEEVYKQFGFITVIEPFIWLNVTNQYQYVFSHCPIPQQQLNELGRYTRNIHGHLHGQPGTDPVQDDRYYDIYNETGLPRSFHTIITELNNRKE